MGQFAAAKQFAHVCAGGFVVKLYGPASGMMDSHRGSGLASFRASLCFERRSGLGVLFLPGASVQFLDEVSQVLAVRGIEEQFVFRLVALSACDCDFQRRVSETLRSAFAV